MLTLRRQTREFVLCVCLLLGLIANRGLVADDEASFLFIKQSCAVTSVRFHPSGESLVTAGEDGDVRIWSISNKRSLGQFTAHVATIYHMEFSRDGRHLLTSSADGWVRIWDFEGQQ